MGARTGAAQAEVVAAREALGVETDRLRGATRDAVDIPAKIRRAPVESAALAGGAAFMVLGGPGRVFGRVKRMVRGTPPPLPKSMLPNDIDKALRGLGSDGDAVRGAIEQSFAEYLDKRGSFAQRNVRSASVEAVASAIRLAGRGVGLTLGRRMLAGDTEDLSQAIERARRTVRREAAAAARAAGHDGLPADASAKGSKDIGPTGS